MRLAWRAHAVVWAPTRRVPVSEGEKNKKSSRIEQHEYPDELFPAGVLTELQVPLASQTGQGPGFIKPSKAEREDVAAVRLDELVSLHF